MMDKTATFRSERATRYMTALCHHFGRRVSASCDDATGWVQFPFGRCEMSVEGGALHLRVQAEDPVRLEQVVEIVSSHLDRFAFRENPHLIWQPAEQHNLPSLKGTRT